MGIVLVIALVLVIWLYRRTTKRLWRNLEVAPAQRYCTRCGAEVRLIGKRSKSQVHA